MTLLRLKSLPRFIVRRLLWGVITVVALVTTLALISAHERALARAHDAAIQAAWQTAAPLVGPALTREALFGRFNIRQGSSSADMNWQAASASDLRASLLAFDLAQIRLTQVKVTRSGAGFAVSAERAP